MAPFTKNGNNMTVRDVESQIEEMKIIPKKEEVEWKVAAKCLESPESTQLQILINKHGIKNVFQPASAVKKQTLLHKAAELGNLSATQTLVNHILKADLFIDTPDYTGNTAIFSAVKNTQLSTLNVLLQSGAHVNARNDSGNSILHEICSLLIDISRNNQQFVTTAVSSQESQLLEILDTILRTKKCDLEAKNDRGLTPLLLAATYIAEKDGLSLIEYSKKLYAHGAYLDAIDRDHKTARKYFESKLVLNKVVEGTFLSPPVKPLPSRFLDALILRQDFNHIKMILNEFKEQDKFILNSFIGSQSVLLFAVDKCDVQLVNILLKSGANSWNDRPAGKLCIYRAFARGNVEILNSLIESMKKQKNMTKLDMTENSFELLENFFTNAKYSMTSSYKEYMKCLKRLLENDVIIDLNQRGKIASQTALDLAANFNNQGVLELFIEKGAFIGSLEGSQGKLFEAISPVTLTKAMDSCIKPHYLYNEEENEEEQRENIISREHTLELNLKFLVPPPNQSSSNEEKDQKTSFKHKFLPDTENSNEFNEVKTLRDIAHDKSHRKSLSHPLLQTFVYAKWRKAMPLFYFNLFTYISFVIFLTLYVYRISDVRMLEETLEKFPDNETMLKSLESKYLESTIFMSFLIPLTFYIFVRELFQLLFTVNTYKKDFENYIEWFLVIFVIALCSFKINSTVTRHISAWALIIAWYEFVFILGRIPSLSVYVVMLRKVSTNFLKLLFLFGWLIISFSVSFSILLSPVDEETSFYTIWTTIPKAIVMATGEFDYGDLSKSLFTTHAFYTASAVLIFLLFLFLIFLVLMNVMNGLAVTDTREIAEHATLYSMKSRIELIYLVEKMLISMPGAAAFLKRTFGFSKNILSGTKDAKLFVRVNEPEKSKRIMYGEQNEQFSKLNSETTKLLRSFRLERLYEEEEKAKMEPILECLALLRELKIKLDNNN